MIDSTRRVLNVIGAPGSLVLPGLTDREAAELTRHLDNACRKRAMSRGLDHEAIPVDLLVALSKAIGGPIQAKYRTVEATDEAGE